MIFSQEAETKPLFPDWEKYSAKEFVLYLPDGWDVGRTVFEQNFMDLNMRFAQYLIKKNNVMWILTFSAGQENFHEYTESFNQIIESFVFKQ